MKKTKYLLSRDVQQYVESVNLVLTVNAIDNPSYLYEGLSIECKIDRGGGFGFEYLFISSRFLKVYSSTFRKIERELTELANLYGYPRSFGQYTANICSVLNISSLYDGSGNSINDIVSYIDTMVNELSESLR